MRKSARYLLILAAIGAAIGVLYAYFHEKDEEEDLTCDDPTDDSFDSDEESTPTAEREYVPLNQTKSSEDAKENSQES